jgi:hypothetical protein
VSLECVALVSEASFTRESSRLGHRVRTRTDLGLLELGEFLPCTQKSFHSLDVLLLLEACECIEVVKSLAKDSA